MELKVLGPLDLVMEGQRIQLGGHRQRVVLAMLTLHANRVTSTDQLAEAAWGPAAPPTARAQIQTCVSALRKMFTGAGHPAAIETRAPGYLLHLSHEQLDLMRFERLLTEATSWVRDGNLTEGLATLHEALKMWRGEPLGDLDSGVLHRHAVNLTERYREAQLERIRLEIDLGRHADAMAELQEITATDPFREEPHRLLMLALHRSGRQAEALEVYRRARTLFVDHLGIEPGRRLIDLERMILNDETRSVGFPDLPGRRAPRAAEEAPHLLPAGISDFVGRSDELETIAHHLIGRPENAVPLPVLSISGPVGAGASALAIHAAQASAAHFIDGQLYANLRESEPEDVRTQFLHSLGVEPDSIPEDPQLCAAMLRSRLAGKQVLLLLDNVSNEEQVSGLLPGSPSCAVIVTSRRRLAGLAGAHQVDLGAFSGGQALKFLRCALGTARVEAERQAAQDIIDCCDRLPLALRIAATRLVARPHWSLRHLAERLSDEDGRLCELSYGALDIGVALSHSQQDLSPGAAHLLHLLALVESPRYTSWMAAALLAAHPAQGHDLLEELADARVLQPVDTGWFRLPPLVRLHARQQLLAEVPPASRGAALARLHSAWLVLAERAHREIYGSDHVVAHGSAPRWILSEAALSAAATDPVEWLRAEGASLINCLHSAYSDRDDELCWQLSVVSASLFTCSRQFEYAQVAVAIGRLAATRAASPAGSAAMDYACGVLALTRRELALAETALDAAVAGFTAGGDQHGYAMALTERALLDCVRSESAAALARCGTAAAALDPDRDAAAEVTLLCVTAHALAGLGRTAAALDRLDAALASCQEIGYRRGEARVLYQRGLALLVDGDLEQAAALLDRALRLAVEFGDRLVEAIVHAALGGHACAAKAWQPASAHLTTAAALFDEIGCGRRTAELEPVLMAAVVEALTELAPL